MTIHPSMANDDHGSRLGFSGWLRIVLVVLFGGLLALLAAPSAAHADAGDRWTDTPYGPLGPGDRELVIRVKLANLWEIPAGRLAQDHAGSARTKDVGRQLERDHLGLDVQVKELAPQLGITLPDKPTVEQQAWVAELTRKRGTDFDIAFANLLRSAHGQIFAMVANVRAGSRNDSVRAFAETANNVVMKHMALLESTGRVDYDALPPPADPFPSNAERIQHTFGNGRGQPLVWTVLIAAIIAGTSAAVRVIRPR
jgi:predicted outer membrane protein